MTEQQFSKICKEAVVNYMKANPMPEMYRDVNVDDVYIVWMVRVLQNNKALASTIFPDKHYYEITYDGDADRIYVDVYKKETQVKIEGVTVHE